MQQADSLEALAALVENYVQTIDQPRLVMLPVVCQNALKDAPNDVRGTAHLLLQFELKSVDREAGALLHEIAHTFIAASNRWSFIESREKD